MLRHCTLFFEVTICRIKMFGRAKTPKAGTLQKQSRVGSATMDRPQKIRIAFLSLFPLCLMELTVLKRTTDHASPEAMRGGGGHTGKSSAELGVLMLFCHYTTKRRPNSMSVVRECAL